MRYRVLLLILVSIFLTGCNLLPSKAKTGLQVMTNDAVSSVFINGQFIDKTPIIDKSLTPGVYELKIVPDDPLLMPYQTQVVLRERLLTVVTWIPGRSVETSGGVVYEMEPLRDKNLAEISFVTIPNEAIITLDEGKKEFAPKVYSNVSPGNHVYEATLPSFKAQRHTINVVQGYRMIIKITLAKIDEVSVVKDSQSTEVVKSSSVSAAIEATLAGKIVSILPTNYFIDGIEVLRMRKDPRSDGLEVGNVVVGKKLPLLAIEADWFKIKEASTEGWISNRYAEILP